MTIEPQLAPFRRMDLSLAELHAAAEGLGAVVEPAAFWGDLANDASRPAAQRQLALDLLVRRHLQPGVTTIADLAAMLAGAHWLADDAVTNVANLGGKIPIRRQPGETAVAIAVPGGGALYLAITGRFTAPALTAALHGLSTARHLQTAVVQAAQLQANN